MTTDVSTRQDHDPTAAARAGRRRRRRPISQCVAAVVATGLAASVGVVVTATPASASLGESRTVVTLRPSSPVTFPTEVTADIGVYDVSDSCELFDDCDPPEGYVDIYLDGVAVIQNLDIYPVILQDDVSAASYSIGFPDYGDHLVTVHYHGGFDPSAAEAAITVDRGTCTLDLVQSTTDSVAGDTVEFTVNHPPVDSIGSTILFYDQAGRLLGESVIYWDGFLRIFATLSTSALPVGTSEIHATWPGNRNFYPCTSNRLLHTVHVPNTPPVASDDFAAADLGQPVVIDVLANDTNTEADPLTVTVTAPPANGVAQVGPDGRITYTPNPGFEGPTDVFDYQIAEPSGAADVGTVFVVVVCLVERPDSYDVAHGTPLVVADPGVLANDSHACDPAKGVRVIDQPQHGTVALRPTGGFTYTPAAGYSGTDSFTYVFIDALFQGPKATVTLTVAEAPNQLPVATDRSVSLVEDTPTPVVLGGVDPDGDALSFSVSDAPDHGTLSGTGPNLTYTPAANYTGPDSFQFSVSDGRGGVDVGTVSITVQPAPMVFTGLTFLSGTRVIGPTKITFENMKARLTRWLSGAPVAGQSITFAVDGTIVCTAITDANGVGTCSGGSRPLSRRPYTIIAATWYLGDGYDFFGSLSFGLLTTRVVR